MNELEFAKRVNDFATAEQDDWAIRTGHTNIGVSPVGWSRRELILANLELQRRGALTLLHHFEMPPTN
jgi:hypothetical protein